MSSEPENQLLLFCKSWKNGIFPGAVARFRERLPLVLTPYLVTNEQEKILAEHFSFRNRFFSHSINTRRAGNQDAVTGIQ